MRLKATARPSCTHSIDTTAIDAPVRVDDRVGRGAVFGVMAAADSMWSGCAGRVHGGPPVMPYSTEQVVPGTRSTTKHTLAPASNVWLPDRPPMV